MTPQKKLRKPFDPSRKAGPDNPLPDAVYDQKGDFVGYEPKVVGRGERERSAPRAESGVRSAPASNQPNDSSPPRNWRTERAKKSFGENVVQDVRETVDDIKDEPSEVPFRIKERVKEYLPRWLQFKREK